MMERHGGVARGRLENWSQSLSCSMLLSAQQQTIILNNEIPHNGTRFVNYACNVELSNIS
jgi:hypothetical protein